MSPPARTPNSLIYDCSKSGLFAHPKGGPLSPLGVFPALPGLLDFGLILLAQ
jgi:hypothetical protein